MSAHMPGCVYSRSAGRWTYRAAGCAAPEEHGRCPDCDGRGWVRAIRDWRKPDGRACQVRGDTWQPVEPKTLGEVVSADLAAGVQPWTSLNRNPFFRPDFWELADGAFGRWTGEPGKSAIELTDAGVEALRRWVRPAVDAAPPPRASPTNPAEE